MNTYPDLLSKMALCMSAAQLAKDNFVDEFGIGEDLTFNFFGWKDDNLIVVSQLRQEYSHLPVEQRLMLSSMVLGHMRYSWGIDAISAVAEGFETLDKNSLQGRDLAVAFVEEKGLVKECLTVTHCEPNEITSMLEVYLVSTTYTYSLGRTVEWGSPVGFTKGTEKVLKNSPLPRILIECLTMTAPGNVTDEEIESSIVEIEKLGFNIQEFAPLD
jgi:hypothetical protein